MFFARDDEIVQVAAKIARCQEPEQIILCWIQDTAHLEKLWVSANALPLLPQDGVVEVLGPAQPLPFGQKGLLAWSES